MSMVRTAHHAMARTAVFSPGRSPAIVKTDRLWEGSAEWFSIRTPGTARASPASISTIAGRRPSLMFGTHSMRAITRPHGLHRVHLQHPEHRLVHVRTVLLNCRVL